MSTETPEVDTENRISLVEHLDGISKNSSAKDIRAAVRAAMADGWDLDAVKAQLHAQGLTEKLIGVALGKNKRKTGPAGDTSERFSQSAPGLSNGYAFSTDGAVEVLREQDDGTVVAYPVCSHMRALYHVSDMNGLGWATDVAVRDRRGHDHPVRISNGMLQTDPRAVVQKLSEAGLRTFVPPRVVAGAISDAAVPLARFSAASGWQMRGAVFALPGRIIGKMPDGEVLVADVGDRCRAGMEGTLEKWMSEVAAPCDGNPIPMVAVGTMLAGPAIEFLGGHAEVNTMIHIIGPSTGGKTTSLRAGGSVWGAGLPTSAPTSFLHPWRTTANASENLLAAHNHVGIAFDELKSFDRKAASSFAYDFANGRAKARMTADGMLRPEVVWELFALSSGERTLADLADEGQARHRQVQDAGVDVRVINIGAADIFRELHGAPDAKSFSEQLADASTRSYGHAGPAFVAWLAEHGDEARERLRLLHLAWGQVSAAKLPAGAAAQAGRVASRLGSIAICAALAADVVGVPWSAGAGDDALNASLSDGGAKAGPAARAMLWAFSEILAAWITEYGATSSTEESALLRDLIGFFHMSPGRFQSSTYGGAGVDKDHATSIPDRLGWAVRDGNEVLLNVDCLPSALRQKLGWSDTQVRRAIRAIAAKGLLVRSKHSELTFRRRGDGGMANVYRINAAFFESNP